MNQPFAEGQRLKATGSCGDEVCMGNLFAGTIGEGCILELAENYVTRCAGCPNKPKNSR